MSKAKLRKTMYENDTYVLPHDILFDVLIKVPVPSLLRFKSVSKSWNAIISDNNMFAKAQRDQSKELGRQKIMLQRTTGEFEFIHLENHKGIVEKQNFPIKKFQRAHILCSCDGLVLLKKPKAYKKFVLWNPSSGQHRTIECPYHKLYNHNLPHACGLCYDSDTDDYKVILIYSVFYVVYSTSKGSWSTMKINLPILVQHLPSFKLQPNSRLFLCVGGICMEGRVYWSLKNKIEPFVRKTSTIIYFDMKSDELKKLPTPLFVREDENVLFSLSSVNGCLCLYGGKCVTHELNIWIMEQNDWKLLMRINRSINYFIHCLKLLCCTKNGEFIFDGPGYNKLSIYDPKIKRFVTTTYISNPIEYVLPYATPILCLDSLYFPSNVMHKKKKLKHIRQ
ncbi:hypothetical protein R3W88_025793 [Solanum pinnatisectum]|uniref:F-box domain-containing protein n=1 Tax=Solanum pinnatisectum TaxID=50273 RepID=A0AAV9M433_9SOLN|nr:hypothetical protein R3W88_025793 [Solanum pinnatisectum]